MMLSANISLGRHRLMLSMSGTTCVLKRYVNGLCSVEVEEEEEECEEEEGDEGGLEERGGIDIGGGIGGGAEGPKALANDSPILRPMPMIEFIMR